MLTTESLKRIDREIAKYPDDRKQSAVVASLAIAQEEKGWLSNETIEAYSDAIVSLFMPGLEAAEAAGKK